MLFLLKLLPEVFCITFCEEELAASAVISQKLPCDSDGDLGIIDLLFHQLFDARIDERQEPRGIVWLFHYSVQFLIEILLNI